MTLISLLFDNPILGIAFLVFIVLAITVHEWAHAWAATKFGDDTPRLMGRLNLDPRSHIDPIGGLLFLFVGFGWGRPVIYNPLRLKKRIYELWISLAGPAVNLIAATIFNLLAYLIIQYAGGAAIWVNIVALLTIGAYINVLLAALNLIPLPPLDGSSIIAYFYPPYKSIFAGQFGLLILLFLLFVPVGGQPLIGIIMNPLINIFNTITLGFLV